MMNGTLLAIVTILLLLINYLTTKRKVNYSNLFLFEWSLIVVFSNLHFDNYFSVVEKTYIILSLGIGGFFVGAFFYRIILSKRKMVFTSNRQINYRDFSDKIIMIVLIIHLMSSIYFSIKTFNLLRQGFAYSYVRNIFQGYDRNVVFIKNGIEESIRNWIALPLETIIPTLAVCLFIQKKKIKYFFPLAVLDQGLYLFYSQNKGVLAYLVIYLFIVMSSFWKKISAKARKRIMKFIIIGVIAVVILFAIRNLESTNYTLSETMYKYICGCINMLNEKIKTADRLAYNTYGMSSLYGFVTPFESILGITPIGKTSFYAYATTIQLDKDIFIPIGPSRWMNAYCTTFYDFYLDFRYVGVILGSITLGILAEFGQKKLEKSRESNSTYDLAISLNIAMGIVMSMIRWPFASSNYAMAFLYYYILKILSRKIR